MSTMAIYPSKTGSPKPVQDQPSADPVQGLVSVIIPCYNHAHFLGEAIESTLKQTYQPVEILVVDDGSTDHIHEIMAGYPAVRYLPQPNQGVSRARNYGLSQCRGEYVLFLDADDRLVADALTTQVRMLAAHPDCAFVFGFYLSIGTARCQWALPRTFEVGYRELLRRNFIPNPGSVLHRRRIFSSIEGFDESNGPAADYDLYLRVSKDYSILCTYTPIVEYRKHDSNMSNDPGVMLRAALRAVTKQRPHVRGSARLEDAYRDGYRFYQSFYGEPLVERIHDRWSSRNRLGAFLDLCTLMRWVPLRLPNYFVRRLTKLLTFR